ncbi:hypothetical protein Poly30_32640 [Planctomycetes bacterium Poly30]|uniref:Alpha/beta hydrolase family protein n=1 Tax=Saltatorellus ferox TaxID=2528018 RepID=A0A518EUG1_9BACT|nr:hypothetical protein Poly30_32640 [Planctomycetes bacterium Poly30]
MSPLPRSRPGSISVRLTSLATVLVLISCSGTAKVGTDTGSGASESKGGGMTLERAFQGTLGGGGNLNDIGPAQITQSQAAYAWLTSVATPTEIAPLLAAGVGGTILNYSVFVEATQGVELFSLFVPDSPPSQPRPLLAAFHGAATSHGDIYYRALDFFVEADQRDWFLIAPLQANLTGPMDVSYASVQSQLHVETLIELILDTYAIDRDRIYGAGFSMGGGNALSYAARHRDRRTGALAAVVNHTGSVALADIHANAPPSIAAVMEVIFGGPPSGPVFEWQRSSLIELDAAGSLLPQGKHMAKNLQHVPVQTWFNSQDMFGYLRNQAQQFSTFMQSLGGTQHQMITVPGGIPLCAGQHCWGTLDIGSACDWLALQSLDSNPGAGTVLVDRDSRWANFDVKQRLAGAFSSFEFTINTATNELLVRFPRNVKSLACRPAKLGLSVGAPLVLRTSSAESAGTAFEMGGYSNAPTSVQRNGVALGATCGGAANAIGWCYDALAETVTIRETSNLSVQWRIQ